MTGNGESEDNDHDDDDDDNDSDVYVNHVIVSALYVNVRNVSSVDVALISLVT
jgi:hypothetical protein